MPPGPGFPQEPTVSFPSSALPFLPSFQPDPLEGSLTAFMGFFSEVLRPWLQGGTGGARAYQQDF